jgi:competence protein ComEA
MGKSINHKQESLVIKKLLVSATLVLASGLALAGPININTADEKALAKELVGVGPEKAAAIVKYRTEKGPFKSPEDLKKVNGIGDATFEQNKANIKLKD